jgi:hypothetical protein
MKRGDGFPGRGDQIHDVSDPAQVLVEDLLRFLEIDVGLLGVADAQDVGAVNQRVGFDCCMLAGGPQEAPSLVVPPG